MITYCRFQELSSVLRGSKETKTIRNKTTPKETFRIVYCSNGKYYCHFTRPAPEGSRTRLIVPIYLSFRWSYFSKANLLRVVFASWYYVVLLGGLGEGLKLWGGQYQDSGDV